MKGTNFLKKWQILNWLTVLALSIALLACGNPNGKIHQVNNLEIYYSNDVGLDYAKKLGNFFESNNLIHPTQIHSVKLTSSPKSFVLKMILNDSLSEVPLDMLKEIEFLEATIAKEVFENRNFVIEITDAYFNPLIQTDN